ncbi:MAG TPA: hypothetical protein VKM55_17340 [Candidatus Lokiarchaeia archaeon]|nr:hypothetical protein [Candidatus Lokiarchaeia archaeon]
MQDFIIISRRIIDIFAITIILHNIKTRGFLGSVPILAFLVGFGLGLLING